MSELTAVLLQLVVWGPWWLGYGVGCLVAAVTRRARRAERHREREVWRWCKRHREWLTMGVEQVWAAMLALLGAGALVLTAPAALGATGLAPSVPLPLGSYRLSSPFGPRRDPIDGSRKNHSGVDLAAPEGTAVYAPRAGRVIVANPYYNAMNGGTVAVRDADGRAWWCLHLSRVDVQVGQEVEQGQQVGAVGATGRATGPHLHLQVYDTDGKVIDPAGLYPLGL